MVFRVLIRSLETPCPKRSLTSASGKFLSRILINGGRAGAPLPDLAPTRAVPTPPVDPGLTPEEGVWALAGGGMSASGGRGGGDFFGFTAVGRMGLYIRVRVVSVSILADRSLGLGSGVGVGAGEAGVAVRASPPSSPCSVDIEFGIAVVVAAALGGGGPGRCDGVNWAMTGLGTLGQI